jgi:predicted nuclease of predicted toxin-antitoxin system
MQRLAGLISGQALELPPQDPGNSRRRPGRLPVQRVNGSSLSPGLGVLVDLDVPGRAEVGLRELGFEAYNIRELDDLSGKDDRENVDYARVHKMALVTCDRHVGGILIGEGRPPPPCAVYLREQPHESALIVAFVMSRIGVDPFGNLITCWPSRRNKRPAYTEFPYIAALRQREIDTVREHRPAGTIHVFRKDNGRDNTQEGQTA